MPMNAVPLPGTVAVVLAGLLSFVTATPRDWNFVQGVGGIRIMAPVGAGAEARLPIECDVSGLHAITCRPTLLNSGLVIRSVHTSMAEGAIYLRVVTSLPGDGLQPGGVHFADLSRLKPGAYTVYYGRRGDRSHPLGSIRLGPRAGAARSSR